MIKKGQNALQRGLAAHIKKIQTNTARGLDFRGRRMQPSSYNKQYAKRRAAAGLKRRPVNLRATGSMMNSMRIRIRRNRENMSGEIFFLKTRRAPPRAIGGRARGANEKAEFNQAQRKFFGIGPSQLREIIAKVKRGMKQ